MDIDEIKERWLQSNRALEMSLQLNTLLLQQVNLRTAAGSLRRLSSGILLELVVNAIAILLIGSFAANHVRELRFLIPALALGIYAIVLLASGIRQLVAINALDYDEPVVAIQRRLEELRIRRIRATIATLLFGPLMWLPLLVVAARGIFAVDIYRSAGWGWLLANLVFGVAVIPLALLIARRYAFWFEGSALMRNLFDNIAGRSLTQALDSLDSIRRFEAEDDISRATC